MGRRPKPRDDREEKLKDNQAYEWYITNWEGQEGEEFGAWWRRNVVMYDFERESEEYWVRKAFALAGWRGRHGTSELQGPFVVPEFLASLHQLYDKRSKKARGLARPMGGRVRRRRKPKRQLMLRNHQKFDDGEPRGRLKARRTVSPLGNPLSAVQKQKEAAMEKRRLQDHKKHKKRRGERSGQSANTDSGATEER